jgi:hypothetical protein
MEKLHDGESIKENKYGVGVILKTGKLENLFPNQGFDQKNAIKITTVIHAILKRIYERQIEISLEPHDYNLDVKDHDYMPTTVF